ncbi:hypothetical protein GCM10011379_21260 [Filimonas zeae]|uniref:DUF3887 domain-containing protein n=2 Tax=Filimonas zeae TaxID=1737353 RepID=A0A917IWI4_9BACT|nr:hypothetical protein GCM10011379_21260 [Filimonas zeae]
MQTMKYVLIFLLVFCFQASRAQSHAVKGKAQKDTLLEKVLKDMPDESRKAFLKEYNKMSVAKRKEMLEALSFFNVMPVSSKKQLIQNVDTNYAAILVLKTFFNSLVPDEYSIYIEFKEADTFAGFDESIDFWVSRKSKDVEGKEMVFQQWDVELKSPKLDSLLQLTPLKNSDLQELKKYLDKAHCISVSNGVVFEVGFGRSGMGKYTYLLFDKPLTDVEQKDYNDGCRYIFYKNNIVLGYHGGAIGPQCFPDK